MIQTINFLNLRLEIQGSDPRIKKFLENWTKQEQAKALSNNFPSTKDVVRMLSLRADGADLLGPLIIGSSTMHGVNEFQKLNDIINYPTVCDDPSLPPHLNDIKGGENSFFYFHLLKVCEEDKSLSKLFQIIQNTTNKMLTLPQQMKVNPKVAETTFCALLHMIRNFLAIAAIPSADNNGPAGAATNNMIGAMGGMNLSGMGSTSLNLKSIITTIQQFYLWPNPFGSLTRDFLQEVNYEIQAPGYFLRKRLAIECNSVGYVNEESINASSVPTGPASPSSSSSPATSTPTPTTNSTNDVGPVLFYVLDTSDLNAMSYSQILELKKFKPQSMRKLNNGDLPGLFTAQVALPLILGFFHNDKLNLTDDELNFLKNIASAEQILTLYKKCQSMQKETADRPSSESRDIRLRVLTAARDLLKSFMAAGSSTPGAIASTIPPSSLVPPFVPAPAACSHIYLSRPVQYELLTKEEMKIMCILNTNYPTTPLFEELCKVFATYRDSRTPNSITSNSPASTLRFMISGSDELLHNFLCAYLLVKQTKPELLEGIRPRFHILPMSRNNLSSYLARHDSWYNRHIFLPYRCPVFVVPWIKVEELDTSDEDAVKEPIAPPGVYFRQLNESYAREAELSLDLSVFNVEGWNNSPTPPGAFTLNTRFAVTGAAPEPKYDPQIFFKPPPAPPANDTTSSTLPSSNSFNSLPTSPTLSSASTPSSPIPPSLGAIGSSSSSSSLNAAPSNSPDHLVPFIQRVEIGIVAAICEFRKTRRLGPEVKSEDIVKDKAFEFTPTELFVKFSKMDMSGKLMDVVVEDAAIYSSLLLSNVPRRGDHAFPPNPTTPTLELYGKLHKNYQSKGLKTSLLASEPKQQVGEVEIWVANPQATFSISIDGQLFGPYRHIRISAASEKEDPSRRLKFPIQTFFPLDI